MGVIHKGIVLRYTHFGETSAILNIITQNYGIESVLLHGVKKYGGNYGVGALMEWQISRNYSGSGGLPKSSKYDTLDNYSFGGDIEKIALRDCAFELILQVVPQETQEMGNSSDLFNLLIKYLQYLEKPQSNMFFGFWLFCVRFAEFLGYEIDLKHCKKCGSKINTQNKEAVFLSNQSGGFLCENCRVKPNFSGEILRILAFGGTDTDINQKLQVFSHKEKIFITEQLISYIQFHSGKEKKLNSFKFFCDCTNFS